MQVALITGYEQLRWLRMSILEYRQGKANGGWDITAFLRGREIMIFLLHPFVDQPGLGF